MFAFGIVITIGGLYGLSVRAGSINEDSRRTSGSVPASTVPRRARVAKPLKKRLGQDDEECLVDNDGDARHVVVVGSGAVPFGQLPGGSPSSMGDAAVSRLTSSISQSEQDTAQNLRAVLLLPANEV